MMRVGGSLTLVAANHLRAVKLDKVATPPLRIVSGGMGSLVSAKARKRFQLALNKNDRLILINA